VKADRGFNHEITGKLLCPAGVDWTDPELAQNRFSFFNLTIFSESSKSSVPVNWQFLEISGRFYCITATNSMKMIRGVGYYVAPSY
jgi:hypothetical protein